MTTDQLNDQVQQAASPAEAKRILDGATRAQVRAIADLNYVDTEGAKATVIRRILADRFGDAESGSQQIRLSPAQAQALVAAADYGRSHADIWAAATTGTWLSLARLGLIEDPRIAQATRLGRDLLRHMGLLPQAPPLNTLAAGQPGSGKGGTIEAKPEPTRGTWKAHGQPEVFLYYGRALQPGTTGHLVRVKRGGSGWYGGNVEFINPDGTPTGGKEWIGGTATKFWAAPAVTR